jgi:NADH:ubiquinone oxidoreductase subunit 5 (subunit L)/multisubunit Na+/H+ antiporter MnhA subunit
MSGAMIPLGFYGLLKFFPVSGFDATGAQTAGWTLLALGAIGAVGGILFALPQSNLKRLLAFSSVENMGIVSIGLGLGALASATPECASAAALCTAGALAHILNHAFLKGSLFLAAGSVLRQTGTLDQDRLGGLMRRMPVTGTLFAVNAFGLAGLPPMNAFLGELSVYIGAFTLVKSGVASAVAAGFIAIVALAASGGFAAAAYAKAVGCAFLGLPRTDAVVRAVETPKRMWVAIAALTLLSAAMVPGTIWFVHVCTDGSATPALVVSAVAGFCLVALALSLVALRRFVCPRGGEKTVSPGWDCGYEAPTPRMAYTATAFTQPLADLFRPLLRSRRHMVPFSGPPESPSDAAIATETDDLALSGFWRPAFTCAARLFQRLHLLQNGSLHLYILIVIIAVLALLVFALVS